MKCPLFGGCHTVTSIIYINLLEDIATTPTRRGDSSVRGASGRCHAIGMAAGPGEFPGASKTYAISCGWRLVPTPWAKTRQKKKGRSLFHWSCGLRIDPMMKSNESCFFFLSFTWNTGTTLLILTEKEKVQFSFLMWTCTSSKNSWLAYISSWGKGKEKGKEKFSRFPLQDDPLLYKIGSFSTKCNILHSYHQQKYPTESNF